MSSSNPPFRQPKKPDPVDTMLEQWREIKAEKEPDGRPLKLSQLELMMLLLKRP